jgi:predicted regulator of Ras-like GTPase activity (Roadblock/LC7/MglB family)
MPSHDDKILREILEELRHLRREQHQLKEQIMIAQTVLDTSLTNLTGAVAAAAAALASINPVASTPDTVVQAYIAGVDSQTLALSAATPPPVVTAALKH